MLIAAQRLVRGVDELGSALEIDDLAGRLSGPARRQLSELIASERFAMRVPRGSTLSGVYDVITRYVFQAYPNKALVTLKATDRKGLFGGERQDYLRDYFAAYVFMLDQVEILKPRLRDDDPGRILRWLLPILCGINSVSTNGWTASAGDDGRYEIWFFENRGVWDHLHVASDIGATLSPDLLRRLFEDEMKAAGAVGLGCVTTGGSPDLEGEVATELQREELPDGRGVKVLYQGLTQTLFDDDTFIPAVMIERRGYAGRLERHVNTIKASRSRHGLIEAISRFCHVLGRCHFFPQGNTRTANILLDMFLLATEQLPSFIADSNLLEGTNPRMLVPVVLEGQNYFRNVFQIIGRNA